VTINGRGERQAEYRGEAPEALARALRYREGKRPEDSGCRRPLNNDLYGRQFRRGIGFTEAPSAVACGGAVAGPLGARLGGLAASLMRESELEGEFEFELETELEDESEAEAEAEALRHQSRKPSPSSWPRSPPVRRVKPKRKP
jgi:hypothetical protein